MGVVWSKRHHRPDNPHHHHPPLPQPTPPSNPPTSITHLPSISTPSQPPSPTQGYNQVPQPPPNTFASNAPYSTPQPPPQHPYPVHMVYAPQPPPLPPYNYSYSNSSYYSRPFMINQYSNQHPYHVPQISGWGTFPAPPPVQPAPYVDHQSAKRIKNDVNVHKDTIRLQLDESSPDCHLVSFTFDAMVDGSITISYFAKEGERCRFTPVYPEIGPVRIPFQKGIGQKYCQPSGTGIDLGFFDTDDLSKSAPGEDVYPLVISAESSVPPSIDNNSKEDSLIAPPHAQISQAVLEKKDDGSFKVKVINQILWIDGSRYELREIFGMSDSNEASISDVDSEKECIICLTEVKNTAVLPCRHMCMCSDCAKELRLRSNKCPVCRQPIEELMEIKADEVEKD